ncbi:MAG: 2OG-Fe(II) oxygenase [Vicinamibacterales bacterium]
MQERLDRLDWAALERSLWDRGYAHTPALLTPEECRQITALYPDDGRFRSHVQMARYRFGEGEYKYFAHPLPPLVTALREGLYPRLAPIANAWMDALGDATRFPASLADLHAECARHEQTRPTPLLLKYGEGDYNCLHQDLYGDVYFPLQTAVFLNAPGQDYTGGEFLLVEQRPRAQSAGEVIVPQQGEAVIFTTRQRPVKGARGYYRAQMRHGVSRVRSGQRYTLGIIFHDAR